MTPRRERRMRDLLKQLVAELDAPPSTPVVSDSEPPLPSERALRAWAAGQLALKGKSGDPFR